MQLLPCWGFALAATATESPGSVPPAAAPPAEGAARTPAAAGAPLTPDAVAALHTGVVEAIAALHAPFGADPDADSRRVEQAAMAYAQARSELVRAGAVPEPVRETFEQNLRLLAHELQQSRLALACAVADARVRAVHRAGTPAAEEEIAALEAAARALSAEGGPGWQGTAAHFQARAARFRTDRGTLLDQAQRARQQAEVAATAQMRQDVIAAAQRAYQAFADLLAQSPDQAPEPVVEANLRAIQGLKPLAAGLVPRFENAHKDLLVTQAWRAASFEATAGKLAALFQADVVDAGITRKNKLDVTLQAAPGHCYAVTWRPATPTTNGTEVQPAAWRTTTGAALAPFVSRIPGVPETRLEGVCSVDGSSIKLHVPLDNPRKAELRYLIFAWSHEAFPAYLADYLEMSPPDPCDPETLSSVFLHGPKGAWLFLEQEPALVIEAARPPAHRITVQALSGLRLQLTDTEDIRPALTAPATLGEGPPYPGCRPAATATKNQRYPPLQKLAQCHVRLDRKYQKLRKKAERRLKRARGQKAKAKAEQKLSELTATEAQDRSERCDPLQEPLRADWERAHQAVASALQGISDSGAAPRFERWAADRETAVTP